MVKQTLYNYLCKAKRLALSLREAPPIEPGLVLSYDEKFIDIQGGAFLHDRKSLKLIIDKISNRNTMVEVGSLIGFSTKLFARHFKKVFSVDPYIPGYDSHDLNSDKRRLSLARDFFIIRFIDEPNVIQYNEKSSEACSRFEEESLDFVYLDGSHTFEDVDLDIKSWKPKIKRGGYIGGDDFEIEGVKKAVEKNFIDYEVIVGRWIAKID